MKLPKPPRNPWKRLSSQIVYKNPWIRVREDRVQRPDGKPGIYGVVEISPCVVVVPIRNDGMTLILGQWRYALNRYSWELPNGAGKKGENHMKSARRELREEGGLIVRRLYSLGITDQSNGVTTDVGHLYLGLGVREVGAKPDGDEEFEPLWVPFRVAVRMAEDGRITEGVSVAALLRAARHPKAKPFLTAETRRTQTKKGRK